MKLILLFLMISFVAQAEDSYPVLASFPGTDFAKFSSDDKTILTHNKDQNLMILIDTKTQSQKQSFRSLPHIKSVELSTDSRHYFLTDFLNNCVIGYSNNGSTRKSFRCPSHEGREGSNFFSPDGSKVLQFAANHSGYQVLDLSTRRPSIIDIRPEYDWKTELPPFCDQRDPKDIQDNPFCDIKTEAPVYKFDFAPDSKRFIISRVSEITMTVRGDGLTNWRNVGRLNEITIWDLDKKAIIYNREALRGSWKPTEFSVSFAQNGLSALVTYPTNETGLSASYLDFKNEEIKDMELGSVSKGTLSADGKKLGFIRVSKEFKYNYISILDMSSQVEEYCYANFKLASNCKNASNYRVGAMGLDGEYDNTDQIVFTPDNQKLVVSFHARSRSRYYLPSKLLIFDLVNTSKDPSDFSIEVPEARVITKRANSKISFSKDSSKFVVNHPDAGMLIDLTTNTRTLSIPGTLSLSQDGKMLLKVMNSETQLLDISRK